MATHPNIYCHGNLRSYIFIFLSFIERSMSLQAFWLQRGTDGHVGGATPGKLVMGIRVVVCTKVTHIEGRPVDVVTVHPGTDLGFGWAFARAFAKSMILALLFPVCFVLFFFRHNRTGYDIMCRTIVVEDPQRQQHR